MSNYRYSFSFLISSIIFSLIGFSFLLFPQKLEPKKQIQKEVIKIAIITPLIKKKNDIKKAEPIAVKQPVVIPPIPLPTKVQKKRKPKKITKKRKIKKIVKKRKVIKKRKHKKIRKRVVKKRVVRKTIKKRIPPKREVVQFYEPTPQEIIPQEITLPIQPVLKNIVPQRTVSPSPRVSSTIDKSKERKAFLNQIRSKIIANKKYPKIALRRHIQGSVTVKFDINRMGNVNNIRFLNGKTILQKSVKNAIESSFPIDIPHNLKSELPITNISVKIHFNIH